MSTRSLCCLRYSWPFYLTEPSFFLFWLIFSLSLQWFTSYLSSRTAAVFIPPHLSPSSSLTCGVPQGSVLGPSTTSSLKIFNPSYNQTAPILWNNLPKSMRTFSNNHIILLPIVNVPPYKSHFLRPNIAHISKHTFSASHNHLNLLSCSDWPHRSLP